MFFNLNLSGLDQPKNVKKLCFVLKYAYTNIFFMIIYNYRMRVGRKLGIGRAARITKTKHYLMRVGRTPSINLTARITKNKHYRMRVGRN